MNKALIFLFLIFIPCSSFAGDLKFQYYSPSFNGVGYSSHVLTIENIEQTRAKAWQDKIKADAAAAALAANNTLMSKFITNFESRVYAQLSQQLASNMFADGAATSGRFSFQDLSITWQKSPDNTSVTLNVSDSTGSTVITVPIGQFKF